ncbi:MAG: diacylglycerol kinase [Patescibacteria group bacterium]|nr:diacylglycerol kinase [Patescibacteria group bacterium]
MNLTKGLGESFSHAWRGLRLAFVSERSFRIQVIAATVVFFIALVLPLKEHERLILLLAVAAVLVLELLNSAVERLVDLSKPRLHAFAKDIKDIMAAAVLVASAFSLVIGLLVIWPYIGELFRLV